MTDSIVWLFPPSTTNERALETLGGGGVPDMQKLSLAVISLPLWCYQGEISALHQLAFDIAEDEWGTNTVAAPSKK